MNFAEIKRLKELLKTLQESGERTTKTRMDVGNAIEQIRKERAAARIPADVNIEQLFKFLDSSFEKSAALGDKWKPPWDPTWTPLHAGIKRIEPEISSTRAFTINLNSNSPLGVQRRLTDKAINEIATADLPQETKERVLKKLTYRRKILDNAEQEFGSFSTSTGMARELTNDRVIVESNIRNIVGLKLSGTSIWSQKELDDLLKAQFVKRNELDRTISGMRAGLPLDRITSKKLESLDDSIYKMGATRWDEKKGVPLDWLNTNKAYETPTTTEQLSGSFFTGARIPGTPGSDLLSFKDPKKILNKATVFTQKQWRDKESAQQELQFINNYLTDPEMAAEYAKTAPFSFFKYWSKKGGTLGLKEHMRSLKAAARTEDEEFFKTKWGALTTVKDVKDKNFAFASLRGQVTELWDPSSPKISQVGLFQDATGEKIKFTIWKNQQNVPKVEAGKNYYFGNVASQEWQGKWNLNVNKFSAIEEIKPMPFNTAPPLIIPGSKVELRDYSKPYSIDPTKGTITYTTKSGKVVEMPIQKADMPPLKKTRLGDEPGDLAAFLPLAGVPFMQGNVTGGMAQTDSISTRRRTAGEDTLEAITGAYNVMGELGSIWGRKIAEADERIKIRRTEATNDRLEIGNLMNILEAVGTAAYPLSYPQQALSGEAAGVGAMEGIRQEITPSMLLGTEDPLIALAEDILLDPLNLIVVGAMGKTKKFSAGLNLLAKSERAEFLPTPKELKYFEEIAKIKGQTVEGYMAALEAIPETKMPLAPTTWGSTKPATKPKIPKTEAPKTETFETGKYDFKERAIISKGVHENQATTTTSEQVFETMRFRSQYYPGYPADFFQKKYGIQYNKIKTEYMAAEGVTAKEFENLAKTDPAFADKMTTWAYGEYGRDIKEKNVWDFFNDETQKASREAMLIDKAPKLDETAHFFSGKIPEWPVITKEIKPQAQKQEFMGYYKGYEPPTVPVDPWYDVKTGKSTVFAPDVAKVVNVETPLVSAAEWDKIEAGRGWYWNSERIDDPVTYYTKKPTSTSPPGSAPMTPEKPAKTPEVKSPVSMGTYVDTDPADVVIDPALKSTKWKDFQKKATKKATQTTAIATTAALIFGLPENEREYNKPQTRKSLVPSGEKGAFENIGDVANYDSYIEGAGMLNTYNMLAGNPKRYVLEDRITPSMALGIQNRDTSLFSAPGAIGTILVDIPTAPTSYLSLGKYGGQAVDALKGYVNTKTGKIGADILKATRDAKDKFAPKGDVGQAGWYDDFLKNIYDPTLRAFKYTSTLANLAYYPTNLVFGLHTNFIGGIKLKSYYQAGKAMLGAGKGDIVTDSGMTMRSVQKEFETLGGKTSGAMDVAPLKNKLLNAPVWLAQKSEEFLRLPVYVQERAAGKTAMEALESTYHLQGNYDRYTRIETEVSKRLIPFYGSLRFALPFSVETALTNPGKLIQIEKLNDAAVEGQDRPFWALGNIVWGGQEDGTFNYKKTMMNDLIGAGTNPLEFAINSMVPITKLPIELYTGTNFYTGKKFDPTLPFWNPNSNPWSNMIMGRQGYNAVNVANIYNGADTRKSTLNLVAGVGTAATQTAINARAAGLSDRDMYRKATGRPNDFSYEQKLALMKKDNWASAQSGISGRFEQLQGGHVYPAALGGAPLPWNYITQTREENMEWLSAQNYIENLPERELQQEEAWGRVEQEYSTGMEEINARTLDTRGRPENEAQKEKKRYDLRKSANIKIYNRQLNTVRSAIRSAEKDLRGEKKKVDDARAKGYTDPTSEAQIKVIEAVLTEHRALYEKVSGLRDAEQGKEFELPVQGTDLSRFQPMDIGGYDKYAVRYGKGTELAKPEDIEKLADLKKITAYYAASKSYGPVAGFRPGTPEEVKNRILFTRDPRYQELAQIANPLISGAGWEGISGENYIGPRNISEIRAVVEGSVSDQETVMGVGEPPAWYSDQQLSQEPRQATEFDYNGPEFREVVREIIQETLSEGIVSD